MSQEAWTMKLPSGPASALVACVTAVALSLGATAGFAEPQSLASQIEPVRVKYDLPALAAAEALHRQFAPR
jgi:hypothetical protein